MNRSTQNLVLLLVGLSTAVMLVKGTYLNYVKPGLLPWLAVASAALVVLGAVSIARDLRQASAHDHDHDHDHDEHGHRHQPWLGWLLLIPIAMVAFVVPPALDARGATPAAVSAPQRRAFPPLPPGDAPTVSLPEVVMRAAADSTNSLAGRSITLTGFTLHQSGGVDLGRVVIVCCAADAQLARVHLTGPEASTAAEHPEDTWLKIEGQIVPGSSHANDGYIPTMTVTSVTPVEKPANTYAY
ncbi:TIGR03943 family protein [Mycobacterium yunnanensis]|uniref:TIGR03943 family protein n=1 Tax=Mycobacterium yunnanensis TaxID=368477 RepID=A0A9X3BZI6_9MYCO|nr:TIGR03943 family protein [Mycobacterium yunnanensis]MCV7418971.1 TIGR03943 family protein [Mycobacterium yunnanensis]